MVWSSVFFLLCRWFSGLGRGLRSCSEGRMIEPGRAEPVGCTPAGFGLWPLLGGLRMGRFNPERRPSLVNRGRFLEIGRESAEIGPLCCALATGCADGGVPNVKVLDKKPTQSEMSRQIGTTTPSFEVRPSRVFRHSLGEGGQNSGFPSATTLSEEAGCHSHV